MCETNWALNLCSRASLLKPEPAETNQQGQCRRLTGNPNQERKEKRDEKERERERDRERERQTDRQTDRECPRLIV